MFGVFGEGIMRTVGDSDDCSVGGEGEDFEGLF